MGMYDTVEIPCPECGGTVEELSDDREFLRGLADEAESDDLPHAAARIRAIISRHHG